MAVKARDQVTVAVAVDVASVDVYYKLQPSTSVAPSKPTTANPDGWTTIEPTYDEESTNTLYTCQKTTLTDGTFYWSAVSKSTAYEASKTAWNLAHNTSQELANLSVGGVNLIVNDTTIRGRLDGDGNVYDTSNGAYHRHTERIPVEGGTSYILSWFYKITEYSQMFLYVSWFDINGEHISRTNVENIYNDEPSSRKLLAPDTAAFAVVNIPVYLTARCAVKFEKGSIPTDLSLSVRDETAQPNILRGTNQAGVMRGFGEGPTSTWEKGLWYVSSGAENSGDAVIFNVDKCQDVRQRYGFRVNSITSGNKDAAQYDVPWEATTYRITGLVRLTPNLDQTSATMQFRIWGSSAIKSYTQSITSEEWTPFSYAFLLTEQEASVVSSALLGIHGLGSIDFCAVYVHRGYIDRRLSMGEDYLPWQPATEDYAQYGLAESRFSQIDSDFQTLSDAIEAKVSQADVYKMIQPNLAPYFAIAKTDVFDANDNPNGYWKRIVNNSQFTTYEMQIEHNGSRGWSHFAGSISSGSPFVRFEPVPIESLKPSTDYTFMVEIDIVNVASTVTNISLNVCEGITSDVTDPFTERIRSNLLSGENRRYYVATTRDDLSSLTALSRSYLQAYGTGAFDIYLRISLYEGSYVGPYKPYVDQSLTNRVSSAESTLSIHAGQIESKVDATDVYTKNTIDGMFSTEVTNRNTAISQTQSAIEQHVSETYSTKTDTSQMAQPNLSPYFSHPTNDIFNSTTNPDGYWLSVLDTNHWSALTDGWSHAECTAGSSVIYCNCFVRKKPEALKTSTQYTFLIEWRNVEMTTASVNFTITSNNSTYVDPFTDASKLIAISTAEGSSYVFVTTSDDLSSSNILSRGYLTVAANSTVSGDFRISLYEGDYSGPYKPYIDQSLASRVSHAEATLSVHATEIDARVEKDGVIAAINASVEESGGSAVKIQADKVAIDGTAIFTAIKSQTDNAYDAKGAATDVQDNLDNLSIGGRNLLKGTSSIPDSTRVFSRDISCSDAYGWYAYSTKMTITTTENGIKFTHNATTNRDGIVLYLTEENACVGGEDLVLSCEYRTNVSGWYTPYILNTEAPNTQDDNSITAVVSTEEWQRGVWKLNFPSTEDNTTLAFLFGYIGVANGWIEIKKNTLKLEKGNTVTDWSPAPEDVNNDISEVRTIANNAAPKSTAIKRTQRIYYRSNSSTPPQTPGITSSDWVTQTSDVTEIWTAKHISILETYKYIYTCEQSENNSGIVSYTSVLLDDTITVIDGGKLITGSVKTNSIDAESGTFNTANIPVLTADHIKANVISAVNQGTGRIEADKIDVSSISIGSLSGSESLAHKNLIPQPSYFSNVTDVGDGWIHVKYSNSSTSPASHYWNLHHCDDVEPGKTYTIMLEFRNWTCTTNPTGNYMYLQQIGTYQFWGSNGIRSDGKEEAREKYATYVHYEDVIDGSMCAHIVKEADTDHEPSPTANLLRYRMYTPAQSEMEFDIRWSLYEGDYSGPYNAYIDQSLSSRLSTAEDTIDGHTSSIATIGTKADNALTNASTAVEAANNAAKTATNYVTAIDGKGIWLTPSNEKPDSSGDEVVGTTTGWHISDALDLFRKGISMFKVWVDETTNAVLTRIGGTNTGHLLLEQSAIKLCDATGWVGKFDLTTTETAEGFDPIHTVALEVNDGTEQGAHLGLNISHNGTTDRHFVKLGSSLYGVCIDSSGLVSVNASSVSIGPAASEGDDKTFAINDIVHTFGKVLFTGSYSTTKSSTVTLLESAENFYMLRIICEDSSGQHISTDIYEPNNKSFSVTFSVAIPDALYIKSKSYRISGTSISCVQATASGNSYYRHGEAILRASGVTYTTNEVIGIVRVIGFY